MPTLSLPTRAATSARRAPVPRSRTVLGAALAGVLLLGGAACGGDDETGSASETTAASAAPTISDAWARVSASSAANGAMYMQVMGGSEADAVVAVSVPAEVAAEAQLHQTVMAETSDTMAGDTMASDTMAGDTMAGDSVPMSGSMTMREVERVEVPAGDIVSFEPGGYHVMLMGLTSPLVEGSTFEAVVTFDKAGDVTVTVTVRAE